MEFNEVIKRRMSVRKFSDKKVEQEKLEAILEAGRLAPTAKNNQPQVIYVVASSDGLKKIDEVTPCRYNAPCCLLVCSDKSVAFSKENYSTYEMDATIVATHMMLEATNVGIDNIWIEMFDASKVKKVFNLEENIEPVCILNLGYKTEDCPENPRHNVRKNIEEFVKYI